MVSHLSRRVWGLVWLLGGRWSPRPFHYWRVLLLRAGRATVDHTAHPYPTCRVWAPWNLEMKEEACLGDRVDCYCVDQISIGRLAIVSQDVVLCAATHDYNDPEFPLVTKPIVICDYAWVAAGAFIGPGVTIGEGAVVGARAVVMRDVEPWRIVTGNPARVIGERDRDAIRDER